MATDSTAPVLSELSELTAAADATAPGAVAREQP
jgi:hypothetical protein